MARCPYLQEDPVDFVYNCVIWNNRFPTGIVFTYAAFVHSFCTIPMPPKSRTHVLHPKQFWIQFLSIGKILIIWRHLSISIMIIFIRGGVVHIIPSQIILRGLQRELFLDLELSEAAFLCLRGCVPFSIDRLFLHGTSYIRWVHKHFCVCSSYTTS